MDHAAIRATFTNIRNIQGRKVVQLIFEIPVEQAGRVYDSLGWPDATESKWCAIALLNEDAADAAPSS